MTPDEEYQVGLLAQQGDEKAIQKLVNSNLRFVFSVAKMYASQDEWMDDLVSAGNIGLVEAARKFDPSKGFKFISYAVWHVRKEMIEFLSNNSRSVRIPSNKNQLASKIRKGSSEIYSREGREATEEELVDYVRNHTREGSDNFTVDTLRDVLRADQRSISLDSPLKQDSEMTFLDTLGVEANQYDPYHDENVKHLIAQLFSVLTPHERDIIERTSGIGKMVPEHLGDIALEYGVSTEAIRHRQYKAMKKLKIHAKRLKLKIDLSVIFNKP
jgi:RNA polymerase primary sigma factor